MQSIPEYQQIYQRIHLEEYPKVRGCHGLWASVLGPGLHGPHPGIPLGAHGNQPNAQGVRNRIPGGWPQGPWPPPAGGEIHSREARGGEYLPRCSLGNPPRWPPLLGLDYVHSEGPRSQPISGKNR